MRYLLETTNKIRKGSKLKGIYKTASKYKFLYLMLIPGLVWVIIFKYLPMYGLTMAFKDYQIFKGLSDSPWVGLDNFERLISDRYFWPVLRNTLLISFYKIIFGFPVPIMIALMLNEVKNRIYRRSVQTMIYFPHFISWIIVAGLMYILFSDQGLVNQIVESMGGESQIWMADPKYFRSIITASSIWKEAGWGTVIYMAALSGIDPQLYEAAFMDGANRLQRIWYITLPCLMPTIIILLTLRMGRVMQAGFGQVLALINPNVRQVGEIIDTYVYRIGLEQAEYSFSTAVGFFKSVSNFILIISANYLVKKSDHESLF